MQVEINNQRKAFLDMLAWSEGTDNGRQKTQKSWLWRHCRRRAIYWLLRSPSQTCHAKPKTQINRRRTLPALSRCGMPTASSFGLKDFSPKSQDAVALQQIKERGALPMIVWWYPSGNRPLQQYLGFTAGRWLWSVRTQGWQPDCKIQRSGRNGQRDWWAIESPRLSPLWLSASSSARHGLLIITVITPLPGSFQRQKCQRTEAGERGNYRHADASAWCCCARCKIHEGVSWC